MQNAPQPNLVWGCTAPSKEHEYNPVANRVQGRIPNQEKIVKNMEKKNKKTAFLHNIFWLSNCKLLQNYSMCISALLCTQIAATATK